MIYLVQHFLEESARRLPDKVALICGDQRLTYAQINEEADWLAAALQDMGIERQDRVAIFLDNSVESVIALYGILKAGAIFIMLSAMMKARKLHYILMDSGAHALITQTNKTRIVQEALKGAIDLENIIWCTPKGSKRLPALATRNQHPAANHLWEDLYSEPSSLPTSQPPASNIALDLATIIYTSGSTGNPKGVMSAHYNVVSAATSIISYLENDVDDIILCALPLSFDYGLYQIMMAFMFGGTVVLEKSFLYPYRIIEHLVQEKVTGFPIVPTMAAMILQMEKLRTFDFGNLRYISNTAAVLPVAHIGKLRALFPKTKIYSMYGLTECKRVSYLPPEELENRPDSVGIPMPNTEVYIVDESGNEVGPDVVGELVVRGSNVMQGYWNSPEETALCFKPGKYSGDGLLYTGDLFRRDKDGFLYFVGRKDDMIKTKGERVFPKEIENCLCEFHGVSESAVIGVPDDIFGQAIKAFIVSNHKHQVAEKQILKYCQQNLEPFMVPKYVEFCNGFKKTASGKIDKKVLR